MSQPICLITGVGEATGSALARRFTSGGYQVAMLARNAGRLQTLENELPGSKGFVCDLNDLQALASAISEVQSLLGAPEVLVHNAVAHTFDTFLDADPGDLERNFRVNTTSLLHLARALVPAMIEAGHGAIMVTGNTASHRGVPQYALFAPTKAAQRILCEAFARELGPQGIHVGYITIDAAIDAPWLGPDDKKPGWLVPPVDWKWPRDDFFAKPEAIAEEVYHLAHQDCSTWAFDLVVRPFAEKW